MLTSESSPCILVLFMDKCSSFRDIEGLCLASLLSLLGSSTLPFTCLCVLDEANHSLITDRVKLLVGVGLQSLPCTLRDGFLDLIPEVSNELF